MAGPIAQPDNTVPSSMFIRKADRDAVKANDHGRAPILEADGFLHSEFLKYILSFKTRETFDGTTTPVPVLLASDNYLQRADANVTGLQGFYGFVKEAATGKTAEFLNGQQYTTAASQSHTVNAGTDRIVIIKIGFTAATTVSPSAVTWNGITCTRLLTSHGTNAGQDVWYCVAGNSGSNQTGNIVITGGTGQQSVFATNWQYVDQASPFQGTAQIVRQGSGLSIATTITPTQSVAPILQFHSDSNGNTITMDSKLAVRYTQGVSRVQADGTLYGARTLNFTSSTVSASYTAANPGIGSVLALRSSTTNDDTVEVWFEGRVPGFTGLTQDAPYFVSDTVGTITATAPTNRIKVGVAVSATEIFVQAPKRRANGNGGAVGSASGSLRVDCGFMPSVVRLSAMSAVASTPAPVADMNATWVNGVIAGVASYPNASTPVVSNSARLYDPGAASSTYMEFTITNIDNTGFTITWTESGSFSTTFNAFTWEAEE